MAGVSFKQSLNGELAPFLNQAGFECAATREGLLHIVTRLANYREEGEELFPKVLISTDIQELAGIMGGCEVLVLKETEIVDSNSYRKALKECAPLAAKGWCLFVERGAEKLRYGMLREPSSNISFDTRTAFIDASEPQALAAVFVGTLAPQAVEVISLRGEIRNCFFSGAWNHDANPREDIESLARAIAGEEGPGTSFFSTTLSQSFEGGHGSLVAVMKTNAARPEALGDTLWLPIEIDFGEMVDAVNNNEDQASVRLQGYAELLRGMLNSDGITVFREAAHLCGYRGFVPRPESDEPPSQQAGGARTRAFQVLKSLVANGELLACFFRSADGRTEYYDGK